MDDIKYAGLNTLSAIKEQVALKDHAHATLSITVNDGVATLKEYDGSTDVSLTVSAPGHTHNYIPSTNRVTAIGYNSTNYLYVTIDGTNYSIPYGFTNYGSVNYLPLSGGTLSGNLTVSMSGTNECQVNVSNGGHSGRLVSSASYKFGVYDTTYGKWIVYSDTDGKVYVDGVRAHHWTSFNVNTSVTLPENNGNGTTYLIMTAHNSSDNLNGLWIYRPGSNAIWPIREASGVKFSLNGLNITVSCSSATPSCHYLQIF